MKKSSRGTKGRSPKGNVFTLELDAHVFEVQLTEQESSAFQEMVRLSDKDGAFILYSIAHHLNPEKYRDVEPERRWLSLSDDQKLSVLNGENFIQGRVLYKIKSKLLAAAKDAGFEELNTSFPFITKSSWEVPFDLYWLDTERFKILGVRSVQQPF